MNERRKYKRVAGRLRVIYKVEEEIAEASAYSIDISAGGFCLEMGRRMDTNALLILPLIMKGLSPVRAGWSGRNEGMTKIRTGQFCMQQGFVLRILN